MKVGDTVMFIDEESRYVKWFYGKIGRVQYVSDYPLPVDPGIVDTPGSTISTMTTRTAYSDFPCEQLYHPC